MRTAERAKIWAAIRDSPRRANKLKSFSFGNIPGLQDGRIDFESPITAICGVNGTGKSALLRGIWAALNWEGVADFPEIAERLKSFSAEAHVEIDGEISVKSITPEQKGQGAVGFPLLHIDPSVSAASLQRRVCGINELPDFLEPHEPIRLSERNRDTLSLILNKKYEFIDIFEIDDYAEETPFPIISVSEHGFKYDTRTMSLGEISVFTIFWSLYRANSGSLVLLEEPETYLSPVSQGALIDYLASVCVEKQLTIVLTTHSPRMFARLSKEQVKFVYRAVPDATFASPAQFDAMRHAVGLDSLIDRVLLVEDRAAREFLRILLSTFDHQVLLRSEIVDTGGAGEITRICSSFPNRVNSIRLVGVYDGDSRDEADTTASKWPTLFLPMANSLEEEFKSLVETKVDEKEILFGRDAENVRVILAQIRGLDHHDWFEELGKALHLNYNDLIGQCFHLWCEEIFNEAQVENFALDLRQRIAN